MLIYKKAELLNFSIYWNIRTQRRFATMPVGQWTGHDTYAKGGGGREGSKPPYDKSGYDSLLSC
jgi:hypothetical protein